MKRLVLLLLCFHVFNVWAGYFDDFVVNEIGYKITDATLHYVSVNNNALNNSSVNTSISGNIVIPETVEYNGVTYTVTGFSTYCFLNCTNITSVSLPSTIQSIGGWAFFGCTGITSITIPASVTYIGTLAFKGSGLTSVVYNAVNAQVVTNSYDKIFPETVTSIQFGTSVEVIPEVLCRGLSNISGTINLPNVRRVGESAFEGCSGITGLNLGSSLEYLGKNAFKNCTSLTGTVVLSGSLQTVQISSFMNCGQLQHVVFGNGIDTIRYKAFYGCASLGEVLLPNSVKVIDFDAFNGCGAVRQINIGTELKYWGKDAFVVGDQLQLLSMWMLSACTV